MQSVATDDLHSVVCVLYTQVWHPAERVELVEMRFQVQIFPTGRCTFEVDTCQPIVKCWDCKSGLALAMHPVSEKYCDQLCHHGLQKLCILKTTK